MQDIIIEKPYRFIPPHRGNWIPSLVQKVRLVDKYLNWFEGIHSYEIRHADRLTKSLSEGCGILLAPNHCRYADPLAIGFLAREVGVYVYAMASWHLFHQGWLQAFAIRMCGGFSVNREGLDRTSLDTAVDMLTEGRRPLVVFPEGTVFRTNDRLHPLLDGVSFLARTAARRRAKAGRGRVVVHPVAIKYLFRGDLAKTVEPVLASIEERITWSKYHRGTDLLERVQRIGEALLTLKEIQYLGTAQSGTLEERKTRLIERLLAPLESQLLGRVQDDFILPRIKQLRAKIVPPLIEAKVSAEERDVVWRQLEEIYVAQQISSYPNGYLDEPTDMRLLETVERFEEDLTDRASIHRPLHAILEVGEAIEAPIARPKKGEADPIMEPLSQRLQAMLNRLSHEAQPL